MKIDYDPAKRAETLETRRLDMAQAGEVFDGPHLTIEDNRQDYGEIRNITVGFAAGRMLVVAWTPRGETTRVISLSNIIRRIR